MFPFSDVPPPDEEGGVIERTADDDACKSPICNRRPYDGEYCCSSCEAAARKDELWYNHTNDCNFKDSLEG